MRVYMVQTFEEPTAESVMACPELPTLYESRADADEEASGYNTAFKDNTPAVVVEIPVIGAEPTITVAGKEVPPQAKHCECYNSEDAEICTEEAVREQVQQAEVEARN